jgi:hypothetical protein
VLCQDTLPESTAVLETGLARGIPTEVRLVHADPTSFYRVQRGSPEALKNFIEWMIQRKQNGEKIHTNEAVLDYQLSLLNGKPTEWTCMAGYKLFFVSAQGKFWECSMVKTEKHIMDITLDDLFANYRKKPCQAGCGVIARSARRCWWIIRRRWSAARSWRARSGSRAAPPRDGVKRHDRCRAMEKARTM